MSGHVFLFIDVDGYCASGIDSRKIVTPTSDGFRARELGWMYYVSPKDSHGSSGRPAAEPSGPVLLCDNHVRRPPGPGGLMPRRGMAEDPAIPEGLHHAAGSIYFHDDDLQPLSLTDAAVKYTWRLHGLPTAPTSATYGSDATTVSTARLLEVLAALHKIVAEITGEIPVFIYKGGHEGHWVKRAQPDAIVIDLTAFECPPAAKLWTAREKSSDLPIACRHHAVTMKKKSMIHCPQLELAVLLEWVQRSTATVPSPV